jgi:hypothetical protein
VEDLLQITFWVALRTLQYHCSIKNEIQGLIAEDKKSQNLRGERGGQQRGRGRAPYENRGKERADYVQG